MTSHDKYSAELARVQEVVQALNAGKPTKARLIPFRPYVVGQEAPPAHKQGDLVILSLDDITAKPISWLMPGYLAMGDLVCIHGEGGVGKSMLYGELTGIITNGRDWPCQLGPCEQGDVIIVQHEDDYAAVMKPRFQAAGAISNRVHIIDGRMGPDGFPVPAYDLPTLIAQIKEAKRRFPASKIVFIDPITDYLNGIDINKMNDVRGKLTPLRNVAAELGMCICYVHHDVKNRGHKNAKSMAGGSVAFASVARAMLQVSVDPDDADRRFLANSKNNSGPGGRSLAYRIKTVKVHVDQQDLETGRVYWDAEPLTLTADDIMRNANRSVRGKGKTEEARTWLVGILADGPLPAKKIELMAVVEGITPATLRKAKELVAKSVKVSGMDGSWLWQLKSAEDEDAHEDAN